MAGNSWNALVSDVKSAIADMATMGEQAGGAADEAASAANLANEAAAAALEAAQAALGAIEAAQVAAAAWEGVQAEADTLEAGEPATAEVTEKNGVKLFRFGLPQGAAGKDGEKGDTGESGVEFELVGTTLTIKRIV